MIRILRAGQPNFETVDVCQPNWKMPTAAVWIDLVEPNRDEELAVEKALGVQLPTREEMAEIEVSSRLYQEDGATYMTAMLLHKSGTDVPASDPLTFVMVGNRLVTIRYFEPKSFTIFEGQLVRQPEMSISGAATFVNLLEAVVDRTADNLEFTSAEVEMISSEIFAPRTPSNFQPILNRLGRNQTANNKVRDSLVSLSRLVGFATFDAQIEQSQDARDHLDSMQRDIQSLTDHSSYLSGNITFLLDAALGLINIEQNSIIKIFSIVTVAIMPPTLVGAIYGMNFDHMPELHWIAGYPLAIVLMVVSGIAPLVWFKRKGWI